MERKAFGKHLVMFWLTALLLCFAGVCTAAADDTVTVEVTGTYGQTEARSMLEMINEFRTGDGAYFKNTDGTENTDYVGKLSALTYDYKLEEYAMQRAIEIAVSFEHIRPDGTNALSASFWSDNGYTTAGENIAAGQTSAEKAFDSWLEADEDYSGQGHRQNMLGVKVYSSGTVETLNYTSIGIGHVYYNGKHYWVQEFGNKTVTASETTANDAQTTVSVEAAVSRITAKQVTLSSETLLIPLDEEAALPTVSLKILMAESWPSTYRPVTLADVSWTSADSSIAAISSGGITGKTAGTTSISATILGTEYTVPVTVQKIDLTDATVTVSDTCTYTGSAWEPAPTVTLDGIAVSSSCYTVTYTDNVNAGTAAVTVVGKGNCEGTASGTFTINARDIYDAELSVIEDQVYTGSVIKPTLTATYAGKTLVEGTDYTVKYRYCKNVGNSARVYFYGKGNFTEFTYQTFTITPASLDACSVAEIVAQSYTGSAVEPALTVTYGTETLTAGTDYTVVYSNNTEVGTAAATLTGTGNYTGTKEVSFTIQPCDISGCTVDAIADQTYTGKALEPAVTVQNGSVTLAKGTDYTISYSSNVNAGTAAVTLKGIGNYQGSKDVSFTIKAIDLAANGTLAISGDAAYTYDGNAKEPAVTVTVGTETLTAGTGYTVSYENNTAAGTANVTVTGTGNYAGSLTGSFTIGQAGIADCTIAALSAEYYTGKAITPDVSITFGSYTLVKGTDYTLSYTNNKKVGTAAVTIQGTGNFKGSAKATFVIQANSATEDTTESTTASETEAATKSTTKSTTAEETTEGDDSGDETDSDETESGRVVPEGGATLTDAKTGAVYQVTQKSAAADPVAVYQKPKNAKSASVVVPDTITVNGRTCKVTAIANNAFKNNRVLKKVKIGKYVQTIGKNAFYGCTKLTSVTGGASLTKIGDGAFQKCTALKKITIPAKVKTIGKKAFYGCKNLRSVTIKTKLLTAKTVGARAFAGAYKKATVKVPSSRLKLYKKVLRAKGLSKYAKIKK